MAWRNSAGSFGLVTRLLHWGMAALVIGMLILGTRIADMEPGLANLWLYGLHKSLGFLVLGLALLRLVWHRISPPPLPIGPVSAWQTRVARAVHGLIYLFLLAIPLTGWIASSATGIDVMILDRWTMPAIAPVSEAWEEVFFAAHGALTKALIGLLALHIGGALLRGIQQDGTIERMIGG
jgi:cytochrome b561